MSQKPQCLWAQTGGFMGRAGELTVDQEPKRLPGGAAELSSWESKPTRAHISEMQEIPICI